MRVKLDENVAISAAKVFLHRGVESETVLDEGLKGGDDETVFQQAHKEGRLLVTCDLDFADIRRFPPSASGGILVLRLTNRSARSIAERLAHLLDTIEVSALRGATTIVSDGGVRMRK